MRYEIKGETLPVVICYLEDGETMITESGAMCWMSPGISRRWMRHVVWRLNPSPGVKNMVFGGEGIFNTVVTGPGHIWLQTMPISAVAGQIARFIPTSK